MQKCAQLPLSLFPTFLFPQLHSVASRQEHSHWFIPPAHGTSSYKSYKFLFGSWPFRTCCNSLIKIILGLTSNPGNRIISDGHCNDCLRNAAYAGPSRATQPEILFIWQLRKLGLLSLGERRLQGDVPAVFQCLKGLQELGRDFSQGQ